MFFGVEIVRDSLISKGNTSIYSEVDLNHEIKSQKKILVTLPLVKVCVSAITLPPATLTTLHHCREVWPPFRNKVYLRIKT